MIGIVRRLTIILLSFFPAFAAGQETLADTIQLKPVEISRPAEKHIPGSILYRSDSASLSHYRFEPLPELLRRTTPLFIRDYGPGTLSSVSLRGSGSSHTSIYWHGIPLNQANVGMYDLALMPVMPGSMVTVQSGGGTAFYGSGAIGGSILFNRLPQFKKKTALSAGIEAGSFGRRGGRGSFTRSDSVYWFSLAVWHHQAVNDYSFINTAASGSPTDTLTNAAQQRSGIMLDAALLTNKETIISWHAWAQGAYREIPPLMTAAFSAAFQEDITLRNVIELNRKMKQGALELRAAHTYDYINYEDSLTELISATGAHMYLLAVSRKLDIKKLHLEGGIQAMRHAVANTDYRENLATRNTLALFASGERHFSAMAAGISASARQEWISGGISAMSGHLGLSKRWFKSVTTKAGAGKVFRMPTLNDMYWVPGGNPQLEPEQGWTLDGALETGDKYRRWYWNITAGLYFHHIRNWIVWLPGTRGYWTPQNFYRVEARGSEVSARAGFELKKFKAEVRGTYSFTDSRVKDRLADEESKQLVYVPYNKGNGIITFSCGALSVFVALNATGFVFTDASNQYYLEGYRVIDGGASILLKKNKLQPRLAFRVINLTDASYQSVPWRPMPRRHFLLSLDINLNFIKDDKD